MRALLFSLSFSFFSLAPAFFVRDSFRNASRRLLSGPDLAPYQLNTPWPQTVQEMQDRFKTDMLGILERGNRAFYDDLTKMFLVDTQKLSCFSSGRQLTFAEFRSLLFWLAGYYQHFTEVNMAILSQDETYVHGLFSYTTNNANGKRVVGRWIYSATYHIRRGSFYINYILFSGQCDKVPSSAPTEPVEEIEHFIERVRSKLINGLFLPDGVDQTIQNFEEFGDFISEDAHVDQCDEVTKGNPTSFIKGMSERYHHIRKYKNHQFGHKKNEQSVDITFEVTWTALNETEYRDSYVFRVRKEEEYHPHLDDKLYGWKIFWATRKCQLDVTPYPPLLSGFTYLTEVIKRFSSMINGGTWDTVQSFLDLFDPDHSIWGTCLGAKDMKLDKFRDHMALVTRRYASCYHSAIRVRNLNRMDFSVTFQLSKATEIQEQEELGVGFAGYQNEKGYWKLARMYFECGETRKKRRFYELEPIEELFLLQ